MASIDFNVRRIFAFFWCDVLRVQFVQFLYESYWIIHAICAVVPERLKLSSTIHVKYSNTNWHLHFQLNQSKTVQLSFPRMQEGPEAASKGHLAASSWSRLIKDSSMLAHLARAKKRTLLWSRSRAKQNVEAYCHILSLVFFKQDVETICIS